MTKEAVVAILLAGAGIVAQHAHAQGGPVANYPERPIRLIVGFPPPPGLDIREWYGVIVPAATPAPIVNKLNAEMVKVFKRPDVRKRLTEMGAEFVGSSPQELSKQLAKDVRIWAKWVKDVGVRVD